MTLMPSCCSMVKVLGDHALTLDEHAERAGVDLLAGLRLGFVLFIVLAKAGGRSQAREQRGCGEHPPNCGLPFHSASPSWLRATMRLRCNTSMISSAIASTARFPVCTLREAFR